MSKDSPMLDGLDTANIEMKAAKVRICGVSALSLVFPGTLRLIATTSLD